jgi:prevent-host-death family protein
MVIRTKKRSLVARETAPLYASEAGQHAVTFSRTVPAGDFKARCLALMDDVRDRGGEYIITKRGEPVARLVPVRTERRLLRGSLKGTVKVLGDIVSPLGEPWEALEGWDADDDGP